MSVNTKGGGTTSFIHHSRSEKAVTARLSIVPLPPSVTSWFPDSVSQSLSFMVWHCRESPKTIETFWSMMTSAESLSESFSVITELTNTMHFDNSRCCYCTGHTTRGFPSTVLHSLKCAPGSSSGVKFRIWHVWWSKVSPVMLVNGENSDLHKNAYCRR